MIKCFLSHSSRDKASYVRDVASRLRPEVRVFDEETFEAGMQTAEEISLGLDESTLFVIFLSDAALESSWVKDELANAKSRFDLGQIQRIYPIIIDSTVHYNDTRIPEWMRQTLNIQLILKPTIAARKINARLLELSWTNHPRLRERREIFVGRNELMEQIEERLDDFTRQSPIALIASGLPAIGRKTLLQKSIKKANLVRYSHDFPLITLSSLDSIEDFLLKIADLGFLSGDLPSLATKAVSEKLELVKQAALEVVREGERLLIEDHGVLVQGTGELVDWFEELLEALSPHSHLTFCIASQFRPKPSINRTLPFVYAVAVKELDVAERNGLLNRYARFESLDLPRSELAFFADLLTGLPEQVFFAIDLIKEEGLSKAKSQSHTIQQYGSDKAQVVLEKYKDRKTELDLIYLLSRFEFLSYEVLFDIVPEADYGLALNTLLASSICERLGSSSDYVRVNEVIRDYVSRNRFGIPTEFEESIKRHVKNFVEQYHDDNHDISDYLFSAQEGLRSGQSLPEGMLIPSVFVKTIKRIYDEERGYADAVELSDRVLLRERYLHASTVNHIRFIQCQSLARMRAQRFFDEVRKVPEPDRSFLYGFYYRLAGNYLKAEENLLKVISSDRNRSGRNRRDPRAIGELVLVYMQSEEYGKALELARDNYENRPSNPINANNYFTCLIMRPRSKDNREQLDKIIARISIDTSERAMEMADSMRARIVAYYDGNESESMRLIEDAVLRHPSIDYPLLTKADLSVHFGNAAKLREAVTALERTTGPHAQSYRTLVKFRAMLLSMEGRREEARRLVAKELSGLIPSALQRLNERLDSLIGN
ncbi:MAG: toll/interleukin-1 receptor domain-containing protein [Nevskia sp.]